jgi:hypothetical protein
MVADRKFFWCDKCTRWSTSHSTATHVAKAPGAHVAPAAPNANLVPSFGNFSWCVPIEATKLWDPTTTSTARKALTTRASRKADAKAHRQAAKAALLPTSMVFHAAAQAPKAPREAQPPKAGKAPRDAKPLKAIVEPINKDPSVSYELLRLLGWFSLGIRYSLALLSSRSISAGCRLQQRPVALGLLRTRTTWRHLPRGLGCCCMASSYRGCWPSVPHALQ